MEKGAFCCTVQRECKLVHILWKGKSDTIINKNVHTPYPEIPLLRITASDIHYTDMYTKTHE